MDPLVALIDPIAALESRIEQLEAKFGISPPDTEAQIDSVSSNLLNTVQAIINASTGQENLSEAIRMAFKLDKYTDPNFIEMSEQCNNSKLEIARAEGAIRRHCDYIQRCKQAAPVLESEAINRVPEMQQSVDKILNAAMEVKSEMDTVSQGIQEVAGTCGAAAAATSEQLAVVARQVQGTEQKLCPDQRNDIS